MDDSLRLFVQRIRKIPTLPVIAQEVLNLTANDSVSIAKLEDVIGLDPPIASRILSVSNSVFFGTQVPNTTISNAIVRIGFDNVRHIAFGVALLTMFGDPASRNPLETKRVIKHSLSVGIIGKMLAQHLGTGDRDEVFVCGMLHDLGILVMNSCFGSLYSKVVAEIRHEKSLLAAERKVLGFTHPEIGMWLADKWNLPRHVSESIRFHHEPMSSNNRQIALIHLADYISCKKSFEPVEKANPECLDHSVFDMLEATRADMTEIESLLDGNIFSEGLSVYE
ncbi:MAG TPA: HDOD domain-containing protein [Thermodesulfovibrionales bacterium]|nr:HDOD domain-containing protein [Thermodesulfovibrionales bacterium]